MQREEAQGDLTSMLQSSLLTYQSPPASPREKEGDFAGRIRQVASRFLDFTGLPSMFAHEHQHTSESGGISIGAARVPMSLEECSEGGPSEHNSEVIFEAESKLRKSFMLCIVRLYFRRWEEFCENGGNNSDASCSQAGRRVLASARRRIQDARPAALQEEAQEIGKTIRSLPQELASWKHIAHELAGREVVALKTDEDESLLLQPETESLSPRLEDLEDEEEGRRTSPACIDYSSLVATRQDELELTYKATSTASPLAAEKDGDESSESPPSLIDYASLLSSKLQVTLPCPRLSPSFGELDDGEDLPRIDYSSLVSSSSKVSHDRLASGELPIPSSDSVADRLHTDASVDEDDGEQDSLASSDKAAASIERLLAAWRQTCRLEKQIRSQKQRTLSMSFLEWVETQHSSNAFNQIIIDYSCRRDFQKQKMCFLFLQEQVQKKKTLICSQASLQRTKRNAAAYLQAWSMFSIISRCVARLAQANDLSLLQTTLELWSYDTALTRRAACFRSRKQQHHLLSAFSDWRTHVHYLSGLQRCLKLAKNQRGRRLLAWGLEGLSLSSFLKQRARWSLDMARLEALACAMAAWRLLLQLSLECKVAQVQAGTSQSLEVSDAIALLRRSRGDVEAAIERKQMEDVERVREALGLRVSEGMAASLLEHAAGNVEEAIAVAEEAEKTLIASSHLAEKRKRKALRGLEVARERACDLVLKEAALKSQHASYRMHAALTSWHNVRSGNLLSLKKELELHEQSMFIDMALHFWEWRMRYKWKLKVTTWMLEMEESMRFKTLLQHVTSWRSVRRYRSCLQQTDRQAVESRRTKVLRRRLEEWRCHVNTLRYRRSVLPVLAGKLLHLHHRAIRCAALSDWRAVVCAGKVEEFCSQVAEELQVCASLWLTRSGGDVRRAIAYAKEVEEERTRSSLTERAGRLVSFDECARAVEASEGDLDKAAEILCLSDAWQSATMLARMTATSNTLERWKDACYQIRASRFLLLHHRWGLQRLLLGAWGRRSKERARKLRMLRALVSQRHLRGCLEDWIAMLRWRQSKAASYRRVLDEWRRRAPWLRRAAGDEAEGREVALAVCQLKASVRLSQLVRRWSSLARCSPARCRQTASVVLLWRQKRLACTWTQWSSRLQRRQMLASCGIAVATLRVRRAAARHLRAWARFAHVQSRLVRVSQQQLRAVAIPAWADVAGRSRRRRLRADSVAASSRRRWLAGGFARWQEAMLEQRLRRQRVEAADLLGAEVEAARGSELVRWSMEEWRGLVAGRKEAISQFLRGLAMRRVKEALEVLKGWVWWDKEAKLRRVVATWRDESERRRCRHRRLLEIEEARRLGLLETCASEWLRIAAAFHILARSSRQRRVGEFFGGWRGRMRWRRKLKEDAHTRAVEVGEEAFVRWKRKRKEAAKQEIEEKQKEKQ